MIIDAHCDALYKLWETPELSFQSSPELGVNYEKWQKNHVKIQCFAIYVPEYVHQDHQYQVALEMVDLFFERIIKPNPGIIWVQSQQDLLNLKPDEKGAILTLEGCHPIGEDLVKLKTLIRLGVRAVGLTWNQANAVSDGVGEERGAGLSTFGKEVVQLLNENHIWTDVSHLSYQGFWDVMDLAKYPMASHSNVYALCPHPRNLDDKQITALINRRAFIGVTFVSGFLDESKVATPSQVLQHIQYILNMGGEDSLGFGSDFDGTNMIVDGIVDYDDYDAFIDMLRNHYPQNMINKITHENFIRTFPFKHLEVL